MRKGYSNFLLAVTFTGLDSELCTVAFGGTILAPTDEAFDSMAKEMGYSSFMALTDSNQGNHESKALLVNALLLHASHAVVPKSSFTSAATELPTLLTPRALTVAKDDQGNLTVTGGFAGSTAALTQLDAIVKHGTVVHRISSVLMPFQLQS